MDLTTTYHAFVNKLNISMQSLLDNMRVDKRANGGGSVMWVDMVAICRDQLSRVAIVLSSVIGSGNSTLSENSAPRSVGLASSDGVLMGQAPSSNLSTVGPMQSNG